MVPLRVFDAVKEKRSFLSLLEGIGHRKRIFLLALIVCTKVLTLLCRTQMIQQIIFKNPAQTLLHVLTVSDMPVSYGNSILLV
ncbi:hypothetical protein Y032_0047g1518 [Ancylostoma ceylanicum]|uniref:Uncharacterized protein n=1 Tax=Ancylostoma ceylanicum TaxID=53326 RepID=A0A016UCF3_9BILA|nr:hypothetical protein Y032_0047g1518 [Ancylostoma ceylanicum]